LGESRFDGFRQRQLHGERMTPNPVFRKMVFVGRTGKRMGIAALKFPVSVRGQAAARDAVLERAVGMGLSSWNADGLHLRRERKTATSVA
jgi:hypothetical protein